ncbi:MAG: histidinol-phosphate transaminase [Oscillospiraceae bacterium]|nr:histidinol-phosphate transaminase [Oscillospiraceae bacterium]
MSRFLSGKYADMTPYTPGEQPRNRKYIKLNTNESPFPPSEKALLLAAEEAKSLQLYPDPECLRLREALAARLGAEPEEVLPTNGSDEILNFAFMAFCDKDCGAVFPDITYGFYPVFAELNGVPYREIPLAEDFSVRTGDYCGVNATVFLANPNAPTGMALPRTEIEKILRANPDNVVVIDEAYVDFGGESCVGLIHDYDNLLVTQTFSKSRSMAGARLGFGVGNAELIRDLNTIKYSTNPYNINRMTAAAGLGVLADEEYTRENCRAVEENREFAAAELRALGFECLESRANFILAKHPRTDGAYIYEALKERGILIRHFTKERIKEYNRITVGSREQMQALVEALKEIV